MAGFAKLIVLLAVLVYSPDLSLARRVLLSSIQTLTLHEGKFTTGRRSSPIPQLRCVDGKVRCKNLPSAVQCYNKGSDRIDVQWKCEAQLAKSVQFDSLQVQCEGYDYPDDPYILAGSCGLTYSFKPSGAKSHKRGHSGKSGSFAYTVESESTSSAFWIVCGAIVLMFVIYKWCLAPAAGAATSHQNAGPSAPPFEEPPPYSSHPTNQPPGYGFRPEFSPGSKYETHSATDTDRNEGGGGGFWTGAALGGLAGYFFGSSGSRTNNYYDSTHTYRDTYHDTCRQVYVEDSSSSEGSEGPVTSTGYASTRRR